MIIRMVYILPMLLGRTYDVNKNTIGLDIFAQEDVQDPRVIEESFYRSNFKTVESSSDVKEVLDINGDLSLNIKSGTLAIRGIGSYVKSSVHSQNSVDILIKVSFRTISQSLKHSARPVPGWDRISRDYLGTHFVQSILYGGDLIACIRFRATRAEDLQDIRATIKGSISAGSALDLVGEGKLEALDKKLEKKATMEIDYFATVPLEGVPNTIEGLRELVKQFEHHVKKVNNGLGVPVEVELKEISTFDNNFEYIKNMELETELEFFEEYLDDLLSTKSRLKTLIFEFPETLSKEDEEEISKLSDRVSTVLKKFTATISDMDLQKGSSQLDAAKDAYKEGKGLGMAGKFRRDLNKILKKINSKSKLEAKYSTVYAHFGSRECADDKATHLLHSGYLTTSTRNHLGGGYNYLCLPKTPDAGVFDESKVTTSKGSFVAGVKYGLLQARPFPISKEDQTVLRGVVCSVCLVHRQTLFTFHGQSECPEQGGWKLQLRGYVMAVTDSERSENVCVDRRLDSHQDSYMGQADQSLNFVLVSREAGRFFLPCAVCSK